MSLGIGGTPLIAYIPPGANVVVSDAGFEFIYNNTPILTSALPTAAAAGAGAISLVGDAVTTTFRAALTGSGTLSAGGTVPVFSDGVTWRVG